MKPASSRWLGALGVTLTLAACADAHDLRDDAGPVDATHVGSDAGALDAGASDASAPSPDAVSATRVRCGPNLCGAGEICCSEHCGICAFASECVDFGCAGP